MSHAPAARACDVALDLAVRMAILGLLACGVLLGLALLAQPTRAR